MGSDLPRVGILVGAKGRGTNMEALVRACQSGQVAAEAAVIVAPREGTPAAAAATDLGVPCKVVTSEPIETYGERLNKALAGSDYVCLAGFMRLLPSEVLRAFPNRVLNIHPALLPKFGGKGMYGLRVHETVLASGDTESGCTVHIVDEQYDEGAMILQRRVPILPGDTPETLAARVLEAEHVAYPEALAKVLGGRTA